MLQSFFESMQGQIFVVVLIVLAFALIFKLSKKGDNNIKALTYSAIAVAVAYVLNQITLFRMPQGGSITPFSMLFIVMIGYYFGVRQGILAGVAFGLLDLLINPYVIHPVQMLMDYLLAFGSLGMGAVLAKRGIIPTYLLGVLGRLVCSVLSGVIFFASYAPEGQGAFMYSTIYNGSYMGAEALLTCILLAIPTVRNAINEVKNKVVR
ncbi:thiamine transporter [Alkalibaculum bacchi]|uniref:Thiamine transporter n=1 Tax=Alkalibaculum bacchi TaxID=645887 RepID=A0A366I669_9FIRM|nr:energy-coupled thiamine transporter ThiT [Alkalibaculum bacchi]RBP63268.1 thiamine transporter [Alkalibaculum bacchi]